MKKRNGFAILDFFALVGIIAIVLAVASPFVIRIFKNNEKKAFVKKVEELIATASKVSPSEEQIITILNHEYTSADNLVVNKNLPLAATIKINNENQVSIAAQSKDWCIKKDYDETEYTLSAYNGKCEIASSVTFANITVDTKENNSGIDGLYVDTKNTGKNSELEFGSKYYYSGANPNNYVVVDKNCYRIVNISENNSIKLIYEAAADSKGACTKVVTEKSGYIGKNTWNENNQITDAGLGNWYDSKTTIRTFLEDANKTLSAKGSSKTLELSEVKDYLTVGTFYVGTVKYDKFTNQSLAKDVEQERTNGNEDTPENEVYSFNSYVGLINVTDYVKASTSEVCNSAIDGISGSANCAENNYLYKSGYGFWTLNASNTRAYVWSVNKKGVLAQTNASDTNTYVRPVIYLNNEVVLKGIGTESNPYKIVEVVTLEEDED